MDFLKKIATFFVFANSLILPCVTQADELIYQNLLKRNIYTKVMNAEKMIKEKGLDRFVTLSVVVDEEIIYCHYKKQNRSNLKLIMCY